MSRQHLDFKVPGTDKDSGEADNTAIKPVADGEPGQAAVFKRPSENLRTRTEFLRTAADDMKYLSDYDRALLLTSTGSVTWAGLPTGTFTASADLTLKPFLAPNDSTAARLIIAAGTVGQITFRTRQNGVAGQPRAYNGANTITFDFTPVTTGTGAIVVTADGTPANNVHIQYDDHPVSGTTVDQIPANSMVQQFNASAVAIALGLEAVVEGTGSPAEVGFPTPPASIAATKIADPINGIQPAEMLTRYMSGAADAEKHNISPAQLTTFFTDPLNVLAEGDVLAIRYDELVMVGDGGRRQSIDEFPEDKADDAGLNLFLVRRFPDRVPLALPIAAVVNGQLIFINGRVFNSGETGPLVTAGASYQGSPAAPNSWADGTVVAGPISFESALDTIIQTLGTKSGGTPGSIKIGFTPSGNIAADTVRGAIQELDAEKSGLALNNTFTGTNTFNDAVPNTTAVTATGNGTGSGIVATGGVTNGYGIVAQGQAAGAGIQASGGITGDGVVGNGGATSGTGVSGYALGGSGVGVWGYGESSGYGVRGTGGAGGGTGVHGVGQGAGHGVTGQGGTTGNGGQFTGGSSNGSGVIGTGFGSGSGGTFYAHSTSGPGNAALNGISQSTAGSRGVWGVATGVEPGVYGQGGATSGPGVWGVPGGNGPGLKASAGGSGIGVEANGRVVNVTDPSAAQDAATKAYVDRKVTSPVFASNNVINGNFEYWQRGVGPATMASRGGTGYDTTVVFSADRWIQQTRTTVYNTKTITAEWSRQTAVTGRGNYCMRVRAVSHTGTPAPATVAILGVGQEIDRRMVESLRGRRIGVRVALRAGATMAEAARIQVVSNADGVSLETRTIRNYATPTTLMDETVDNFNLFPNFVGYTFLATADVPSNATGLNLFIGRDSQTNSSAFDATDYLDVAEVMLIAMPAGTTWVDVPNDFWLAGLNATGEMNLVEAFYEKSYSQETAPGTVTSIGALAGGVAAGNGTNYVSFPLRRRTPPRRISGSHANTSWVLYSPTTGATGNVYWENSVGSTGDRGATVQTANSDATNYVSVTGVAGGDYVRFHYVAQNEYT